MAMFWDVFEEMERMRREMDRLMREMWRRGVGEIREPLTDFVDAGDSIIIRMEIPGVSKKDISINLTEDTLEVSAQRKKTKEVVKEGYYKKEMSHKGFMTVRILPVKVIPETAKAHYEDGILEIQVKKAEAEKKKKGVKVKVD
ncbi:MAG TPA: Hsp20/alpha crystallin family protein [Candidatus Aenigmarchaeota archaeon]|nr:Hsp20/alpha crystallin family protein [Candidatus Aenigmarchaeota archaeon]